QADEERRQAVAPDQRAVEVERRDSAGLRSHPGNRRQIWRGRTRITAKAACRIGGIHTTDRPLARARAGPSATASAVVVTGPSGRPWVILVRRKPGLTMRTSPPVPDRESASPCANPSPPALEDP